MNGNRSVNLSLNFTDFNKLVQSALCESFRENGYDVAYCPHCFKLKFVSDFYTDESKHCKECDDSRRTYVPKKLIDSIKAETGFKCALCGENLDNIHHIVPKCHCGMDDASNLIGLCSECHIKAHNGSYGDQNGYNLEIAKKLKEIKCSNKIIID
jgi:hypothetical protein